MEWRWGVILNGHYIIEIRFCWWWEKKTLPSLSFPPLVTLPFLPHPPATHTSHVSKSKWVLFSVKCNQIVSLLIFNATLLAFTDTMKKQLTSVEVIPDSMWISSCCILIGQLLCSAGVSTLAKGRRMSQLLLLGVPALSAVQGTGC